MANVSQLSIQQLNTKIDALLPTDEVTLPNITAARHKALQNEIVDRMNSRIVLIGAISIYTGDGSHKWGYEDFTPKGITMANTNYIVTMVNSSIVNIAWSIRNKTRYGFDWQTYQTFEATATRFLTYMVINTDPAIALEQKR